MGGEVDGDDRELLDKYWSMVFVEDCNEGWLLLFEKGRRSSNINGFSPDEMSSAFPALLLPEPPLLYSPSSPEL